MPYIVENPEDCVSHDGAQISISVSLTVIVTNPCIHSDPLILFLSELHGNTEEFDIDCQTFDGETALILACKEGQASCAQILLESEANVDIINWKYTIHRWFIKGRYFNNL